MKRKSKYSKEQLEKLIKESFSIAEILRKLNLKATGGNYRYINAKIAEFKIDTSHFTGRAWSRGKTKETCPNVARITKLISHTIETALVKEGPVVKPTTLRKLAIEYGIPYKCSSCGNEGEWLNKPLTLHLDHKDGNHTNNEPENLRFLCPNCHQQTPTWGNKKT